MSRKTTTQNEKERYASYLCSREWSEKKEAVRKRAKGKCERCCILPMDACNPCHDFTHAKSDFDPASNVELLQWLIDVKIQETRPMPIEFVYELASPNRSIQTALLILIAINHAVTQARCMSVLNDICIGTVVDFYQHIDDACGFACPSDSLHETIKSTTPQTYEAACHLIGVDCWAKTTDFPPDVD